MKAKDVKKGIKDQTKTASKEQYKRSLDDNAAHTILEDRRNFLKEHRKSLGVEEIWKAADVAYVPHRLTKSAGKKTLVSDDELGWRSKPINLNAEDEWQEDSVPPNPYIKIQTALGIIVDRNPTATLTEGAKKYANNNALMSNLYTRSWGIASSKSALLKPAVFNAAKYGIGVGRTYPLNITKDVSDLVEYSQNGGGVNEDVSFTYFDDVFR